MKRFSEDQVLSRLARLSQNGRAAFAASCAQRLLPSYVSYAKQVGEVSGNATLAITTMGQVWAKLMSASVGAEELRSLEAQLTSILPTEEEAWVAGHPYAVDAAAAIIYALRASLSVDPKQTLWAARRVYEALDNFISNASNIDPTEPGAEERILSHPLIQRELCRQQRDLDALVAAETAGQDMSQFFQELRNRAIDESALLFAE